MELTFRKGTCSDIEAYILFLEEVRAGMSNKDWFYLDPPELIREMMEDGTMELWVAMDGRCMAAAFHILHPGLADYNYGFDLALSESDLQRVVHMDSSAVHPDYRGLGLQRKMVKTAEEALSGTGKRILLCTVHPENSYSLNNMVKQGYAVEKRIAKYGSERCILRKDIF